METAYPMSRTYSAALDLPFDHSLQDVPPLSGSTFKGQAYLTAGNLTVNKQQYNEILGVYPNNSPRLPSRPSIDATSHYLDFTFDPLLQHVFPLSSSTLTGQHFLTAGNLTVFELQCDEASGAYPNNSPQPLSRPSINTTSHYLDSAFDSYQTLPSHSPLQDTGCADYRHARYSGGASCGIDFLGAHNSTNGLTHGFDKPDSSGLVPSHVQTYPDLENCFNDSVFTIGTSDGLGSQLDSINLGFNFVEHSNPPDVSTQPADFLPFLIGNSSAESTTSWNDSSTSSPDTRLSKTPPHSSEASLSRARFPCYHSQCVNRTFSRRSDRDRHTRKHDGDIQHVCPRENCAMTFYRKDKLQSHLRKRH
ncbi:hypothetical protein AOQ84DRAFT_390409 [Glonium stellatum]|uniref:C2H2-type domain-containing protein n=1 Tax=Glonium stellatum TaxID=574774 RepID=A0A8E2EWT8_9PEZI|nr:hypothetical protein AOQ84DRAFT_390409 [Glonium stellatum]